MSKGRNPDKLERLVWVEKTQLVSSLAPNLTQHILSELRALSTYGQRLYSKPKTLVRKAQEKLGVSLASYEPMLERNIV